MSRSENSFSPLALAVFGCVYEGKTDTGGVHKSVCQFIGTKLLFFDFLFYRYNISQKIPIFENTNSLYSMWKKCSLILEPHCHFQPNVVTENTYTPVLHCPCKGDRKDDEQ